MGSSELHELAATVAADAIKTITEDHRVKTPEDRIFALFRTAALLNRRAAALQTPIEPVAKGRGRVISEDLELVGGEKPWVNPMVLEKPEVECVVEEPPRRFRIRKRDRWNWDVERFEKGGRALVGRNAGKVSLDRWVALGHYPSLQSVALGLLDDAILDDGVIAASDLLGRIDQAAETVVASVSALSAGTGDDGQQAEAKGPEEEVVVQVDTAAPEASP